MNIAHIMEVIVACDYHISSSTCAQPVPHNQELP